MDGEAVWSDQDRVDALVWQAEDDEKLPCGHSRTAAMDPANEDLFEVKRLVCHACKAIHDDVASLTDQSAAQYIYFVPQLEDGGGD